MTISQPSMCLRLAKTLLIVETISFTKKVNSPLVPGLSLRDACHKSIKFCFFLNEQLMGHKEIYVWEWFYHRGFSNSIFKYFDYLLISFGLLFFSLNFLCIETREYQRQLVQIILFYHILLLTISLQLCKIWDINF